MLICLTPWHWLTNLCWYLLQRLKMYKYHLPCKYVEDEKLHHTIKFFFMFIQMILNVCVGGEGSHYGTEYGVKKMLLLRMTLKGNIQKYSKLEGKKNKSYIFNSQYISSSLRTHLILSGQWEEWWCWETNFSGRSVRTDLKEWTGFGLIGDNAAFGSASGIQGLSLNLPIL